MNKHSIIIAPGSKYPLKVNRLGYGTMRLTGEGFYGEPPRRNEALQILKRAISEGINFIDTADFYGPDVTNRLIAEAVYPYKDDLLICTKVGAARRPDKSWIPFNSPDNLRSSIENNLRVLKLDTLKLVHFRIMEGHTNLKECLETMFTLQREGKIMHVGVSNVNADELREAIRLGKIASVENMFGHSQRVTLKQPHGETRGAEDIIEICEENNIALIPFFSLATAHSKKDERIAAIAKKYNATETQINIAWLLHRSPCILPIPGTSSLSHLKENIEATKINLTEEDMVYLE